MQYKKVHFIGIGGVGMSATASLLRESGVVVTGSDETVYPPVSDFLAGKGLVYKTPYAAANIPPDCDAIVIGKNAKLVAESNPEVAVALTSGKPVLSFPEVLAELSRGSTSIVVAGSYGKSTTTALIAHCLISAGKDPSYFVGAIPTSMPNAHRGHGELFVLEGDEYPASNTDSRSKFLLMHPSHVIITPLAHDHFNVFPTPTEYLKPFYTLVEHVPTEGTVVVCTEGPLSAEFLSNLKRPVVTYGFEHGSYTASNIVWGEKTHFNILQNGRTVVSIETTELGTHNVQNIVGVAALLLARTLVSPEQLSEAIKTFSGLRRRLDRKSTRTVVPIFEGFGSSLEKLKSAIAAMKLHFAGKRLVVVFEPHTILWRSRAALSHYDKAFVGADKVYIFNPPHEGNAVELSASEIVERVRKHGIAAHTYERAEDILDELERELGENDAVLLSSSGAMGGLIESVPKLAERLFPKK